MQAYLADIFLWEDFKQAGKSQKLHGWGLGPGIHEKTKCTGPGLWELGDT